MRLAARCSQKLLVSISYVPFRAAGYAKSDHPSPPGCLLFGTFRTCRDVRLESVMQLKSGHQRKSPIGWSLVLT